MSGKLLVESISHRFGKQTLFESLSFSAAAGEIVTVTGANGSGKSTLLKIVAGVIEPLSGNVSLVQNTKSIGRAGTTNISFVSPELRWYESISARENLNLYFYTTKDRIAALDTVTEFGIGSTLDKPLTEFSTGMIQRFSLAMAFASDAPLMILDEPLSHLDNDGIDIFNRFIKKTKKDRIILIAQTGENNAVRTKRRITLV